LARASFKDQIAGVVCLSTPFFTARQRDLGAHAKKKQWGAALLPFLFPLWIALRGPASRWVNVVVAVAIAALILWALSAIHDSWWKYGGALLEDFESPKFDFDRTLIIRSPGDEAFGGLTFAQLVARLTVGVWLRAMRLYEWLNARGEELKERKATLIAIAAIELLVSFFFGWVTVLTKFHPEIGSAIALAGVCVAALIILLLFVLWGNSVDSVTVIPLALLSMIVWPVIVLLSVLLLPFGWEVAVANILLDVTAETTPVGQWTVQLVEPPTRQELHKDTLPLMHSVAYESPKVLEALCAWIRGRS